MPTANAIRVMPPDKIKVSKGLLSHRDKINYLIKGYLSEDLPGYNPMTLGSSSFNIS